MASQTIIELLKNAGWGPSRLASALGIKSQAVSQWAEVPARRVPEVERLTGIPAHKLCPSYFPKPRPVKAA
jgi:DNA-binding transcriptional regulator YdaS (Cro superfamily)